MISTSIVQLVLANKNADGPKEICPAPDVAVGGWLQSVVIFGGVATVMPLGRLCVK